MKIRKWLLLAAVAHSVNACAETREIDFASLHAADNIAVRSFEDQLIKVIDDKDTIERIVSFIEPYKTGWTIPMTGAPVPMINLQFFKGRKYLGGFGIGYGFLSDDPRGASMHSIGVSDGELLKITRIVQVDWSDENQKLRHSPIASSSNSAHQVSR